MFQLGTHQLYSNETYTPNEMEIIISFPGVLRIVPLLKTLTQRLWKYHGKLIAEGIVHPSKLECLAAVAV